ncbi:MAG: hypothetical protein IJM92_01840 [Fibrobacter sp.]|uniref:hypothetical protein n=1 Tax=Fibrobacter sp. TaxID=35828 RepID=UPI0025BE3B73|nr:hypothetical protein [Fibrobacter sp.]MBQ7078415.1 hypothetical protein [Fibrobacter sp.]
MENKMNKFGLRKMLAVLAVAFACVCMWGCGDWFDEDTHFDWAEHRTEKSIVGFVDDSLVIAYNARNWYERTDEDDDQVGSGNGNQAIWIYNYRVQLDGPVFMDSLDNGMEENFNYGLGQLSDSVIWGGNVNHLTREMGNVFSFWKIGHKPYKVEIEKKYDGCSVDFRVKKLRTWIDGKVYAQGNTLASSLDTCQYAVLDTVSKTLIYKRLENRLKWIEGCDDVRAWGDDVYCSMSGEHSLGGVILKNETDTLSVPLSFSKGIFWGNMVELRASLCHLGDVKVSCVDTAYTWREPLKFYKDDEVVVDLNI